MITPSGKAAVSHLIVVQSALHTHLEYKSKVLYKAFGEIYCLDKRIEAVWLNGQPHSPKYIKFRDVFQMVACPLHNAMILVSITLCHTGYNKGMYNVIFYNTEEYNTIVRTMEEAL